jgi:hypothetical protein
MRFHRFRCRHSHIFLILSAMVHTYRQWFKAQLLREFSRDFVENKNPRKFPPRELPRWCDAGKDRYVSVVKSFTRSDYEVSVESLPWANDNLNIIKSFTLTRLPPGANGGYKTSFRANCFSEGRFQWFFPWIGGFQIVIPWKSQNIHSLKRCADVRCFDAKPESEGSLTFCLTVRY